MPGATWFNTSKMAKNNTKDLILIGGIPNRMRGSVSKKILEKTFGKTTSIEEPRERERERERDT